MNGEILKHLSVLVLSFHTCHYVQLLIIMIFHIALKSTNKVFLMSYLGTQKIDLTKPRVGLYDEDPVARCGVKDRVCVSTYPCGQRREEGPD